MKKLFLILWPIVLTSCYLEKDVLPDNSPWQYALPSEKGMRESSLLDLDGALNINYYKEVTALAIIKDDHLIFENYYSGSSRNTLKPIGNATYTFMVMIMDAFMQDGLITNLDQPIYELLPEYESIFASDPDKKQITINHLISHKSGISWNEFEVSAVRETSDFIKMKQTTDWTKYVLSMPLLSDPGVRITKNTGTGMILAKIYQNILGDYPLIFYMQDNFLTPLEINHFIWEPDSKGILNGVDGLYISNLDWAKIGYLVANEGRWVNKERILSRDWVLDLVTPQLINSKSYNYGLGWQIFTDEFIQQYFIQANSLYFLNGDIGQTLVVDPTQNLIIAIMAENYYEHNFYNPSLNIFQRVIYAIE